MRTRSITGPVILVALGIIFLLNNVWRDIPFQALLTDYWPFILIGIGILGLLEVLYHASRGVNPPPRPFAAGGGLVWILVIVMFSIWGGTHNGLHLGRLDAGGITVLGTDYTYDVSADSGAEGIARIVFDNIHGNVTLKGQDGGNVKVSGRNLIRAFNRGDADRANKESQIHMSRQGDLLIVRSDEPRTMRMLNISTDIDVTIPKSLSVETRGRSGDITVEDVNGTVDVSSTRGDVRLSNIGKDVKVEADHNSLIRASGLKGNLDVQGRGGDLQLENIAGQVTVSGEFSGTLEFQAIQKALHFQTSRSDLRVAQVPGGITLDGGDAKLTNLIGPVRFETRDRDVHVTDVSESLELTVDRGDVHVTQSRSPLPKMEISVHRSGEVTLAVPEKAGFTIGARTSHGEVQNDFGADLQVESNGRDASLKGRTGNGPEINIVTERGNINLRKD